MRYLNIIELAELLRVDPRHARRLCAAGEIPSMPVGRRNNGSPATYLVALPVAEKAKSDREKKK